MDITKLRILLTVLFFSIILNGCEKEEDDGRSCKVHKRIVAQFGYTGIWVYDDQGRVIKDSVPGSPSATWVINYIGNVISASCYDDFVIHVNDNGYPVQSFAHFEYKAVYNSDGTLQKIRCEENASSTSILDSVVYSDGNIVSYR